MANSFSYKNIANTAEIYYLDDKLYNYQIPFENGYYYNSGNKTYILLKFYMPNKPGYLDTDSRLHIYICKDCNNKSKCLDNNHLNSYFIMVQLHPLYGRLDINNLKIDNYKNDHLIISAEMNNNKLYQTFKYSKSINIKFSNIILNKLKTLEDIQNKSPGFYRELLKEKFPDWDEHTKKEEYPDWEKDNQ